MFLLGTPYKVTTFIIIIESFLIAHHSITKCGTKTLGRPGNFSPHVELRLNVPFITPWFRPKAQLRKYIYIIHIAHTPHTDNNNDSDNVMIIILLLLLLIIISFL